MTDPTPASAPLPDADPQTAAATPPTAEYGTTLAALPAQPDTEGAAAAPSKPTVFGRRSKRRWLHRTLVGIVSTVVVLLLVVSGLTVWSVRRAFPQLRGELALPGLTAPATVYRDGYGIPQIYATSIEDLFLAQGFVHAQDRFWEMDFRRHVTAGRLSELFGPDQVATDAFIRTLGWRRTAEQEWSLLSAESKRYLEAYAAGVNAWLDQTGGSAPSGDKSLEYTVLGLINSGYTVEPWGPVDTMAWLKAMAWDLRGNMADEIDRALLLANGLTREQIADLYPAYPYEMNQPIVDDFAVPVPPVDPALVAADDLAAAAPALAGIADAAAALPELVGRNGAGIGSNSWAIAGQYTATGKPFLANDPHLGPSMPGIWYQNGLHCTCDFNVEGFSFSGVPGVIIGHNARVAWGFTNLGPDVTDLYLERLDGDRYYDGSQWLPLSTREEVIKVAGGDPVTVTVRATPHGPLLSDRSQDLLTISARPPVDRDGAPVETASPAPTPSLNPTENDVPSAAARSPYGISLQWTALQPNTTVNAIFEINRARDWESFRSAAQFFDVPAQNLLYADVDGNIGYQSPGRIPIRAQGDGTWPVPGWDPGYRWEGFIPFDGLPSVLNPAEGFIVTANQAVVGPEYPYLLTQDWDYGFRSQRIREMMTARIAAGPIDAEVIRQMQFDNHNGFAPTLIATVRALRGDPALADVPAHLLDTLLSWDFQQGADSRGAAVYNVFWSTLMTATFDELPAAQRTKADSRSWVILGNLLTQPRSPWWDDQATPMAERLADTVARALVEADAELRRRLGDDPEQWRWGALHTLTLTNATFGTSGIAPIEWLFNRGPYETSGGDSIVNATSWDPVDGHYQVRWVPSMRMIVDLSDLDSSRWVQLTGNSAHAFHPNYADQFPLWQTGQNLAMRWDRASIEAAATDTLILRP